MQCKLTKYDSELAKKESTMLKNQSSPSLLFDGSVVVFNDTAMEELKTKIAALEKEKEELQDMLCSSDSASRKVAEQKRDRLKQLEEDVLKLRELVKSIQFKLLN